MRSTGARRQQGVTLIVGLIMLILITLMVTTAFTLSTTNLRSVGNMQFRNESIAAANKAVEQMVGINFPSGFLSVPIAQTLSFDINNDGNIDYYIAVGHVSAAGVTVGAECIESGVVAGSAGTGACSSANLPGFTCAAPNYNTLWDIRATVTDALSGSKVTVRQGMRMEITEVQRDAVCS